MSDDKKMSVMKFDIYNPQAFELEIQTWITQNVPFEGAKTPFLEKITFLPAITSDAEMEKVNEKRKEIVAFEKATLQKIVKLKAIFNAARKPILAFEKVVKEGTAPARNHILGLLTAWNNEKERLYQEQLKKEQEETKRRIEKMEQMQRENPDQEIIPEPTPVSTATKPTNTGIKKRYRLNISLDPKSSYVQNVPNITVDGRQVPVFILNPEVVSIIKRYHQDKGEILQIENVVVEKETYTTL